MCQSLEHVKEAKKCLKAITDYWRRSEEKMTKKRAEVVKLERKGKTKRWKKDGIIVKMFNAWRWTEIAADLKS